MFVEARPRARCANALLCEQVALTLTLTLTIAITLTLTLTLTLTPTLTPTPRHVGHSWRTGKDMFAVWDAAAARVIAARLEPCGKVR